MGKIYEGENKLNILQVCDKLRNEITSVQAKVLAGYSGAYSGHTAKAQFAHMVLDGYKNLPNTTEHDMIVRKLAKHLMEKYMKSTSTMEGEDSAFRLLVGEIIKKSEE
jgi:hypothetical protein